MYNHDGQESSNNSALFIDKCCGVFLSNLVFSRREVFDRKDTRPKSNNGKLIISPSGFLHSKPFCSYTIQWIEEFVALIFWFTSLDIDLHLLLWFSISCFFLQYIICSAHWNEWYQKASMVPEKLCPNQT